MKTRPAVVQVRLTKHEKEGFELASKLSGLALSSWVRTKLRQAAIRDLEGHGRKVPFIDPVPLGGR